MGEWRKSSYSDGTGGQCVEVSAGGTVLVRDTANRDGAMVSVSAAAWTRFLAALR